jgi:DNA-binding transcriptional LysR family regulator
VDRDLNDALFFTQVIELGSFSAVARRAGVPVSTVSRRITRLEQRLGTSLIARTTRKLGLTEAGRAYHGHVLRAIDAVELAERSVQELGERPRGRVRITAPRGIAQLLLPLVAEFVALHDEVRIELDARERLVDLVDEGFDLAVRTGELADSGLVARKLLESERQLFASPAYLAAQGRPRRPAELAQHQCLAIHRGSERAAWLLRHGRKKIRVRIDARVRVDEMGLAHLACLAGCGIAMLPANLAALDVDSGALVRVLPAVDGGRTPLWLVHTAARSLPNAARAFADHLIERLPTLLPSTRARETTRHIGRARRLDRA